MELNDVERSIKAAMKSVEEEIQSTLASLNNIASDEATLDAKIDKRQQDVERQQKRLAQLQSHRPAYMDEYEQLELHLKSLYAQYVVKFRNAAYLEHLHGDFERQEEQRTLEAEEALRRAVAAARDEEIGALHQIEKLNVATRDSDQEEEGGTMFLRILQNVSVIGPVVHGNITGAGISDESSDSDSASAPSDDEYDSDKLVRIKNELSI